MKKLCRSRGTVHPSPPTITNHLAFLPAYLLTLAASLSPADLEVLAYLITANNADDGGATPAPPSKKGSRKNPSAAKPGGKGRAACSCTVFGGGGGKGGDDGDHDPNFCCDCFRCYMSYWVRWDKSSNRQLIDEIIDAYEAGLAGGSCGNGGNNGRGGKGRKDRRKARGLETAAAGGVVAESPAGLGGGEHKDTEIEDPDRDEGCGEVVGNIGGDEADKGSVRKLVSFIGERIWGVWN
ncbi:hypothetical protein MLD38_019432 [Melastoma candidum]|uniref:Uncharacterized protein n=1 Tax=Melastoma candidum TaxID=119954 RepID=A0ACB9R028_9MYRT|nr:hypothetical protein MLD38_019432 [Melastoma candidum]